MDLSAKPVSITKQPDQKIFGWKCSMDRNHWAYFKEKRCRYCLPIYDQHEVEVNIIFGQTHAST